MKKIGRTYKTKYTKLVEETGGANTSGTASGGEGSTPTQSTSQTTTSGEVIHPVLHWGHYYSDLTQTGLCYKHRHYMPTVIKQPTLLI